MDSSLLKWTLRTNFSTPARWEHRNWLLEVSRPAESKVISGRRVPTYESAPSWWLHSAVPLGYQATSTMRQSFYLDAEPTRLCPILTMLSAWPGSERQVYIFKSLVCSVCSGPVFCLFVVLRPKNVAWEIHTLRINELTLVLDKSFMYQQISLKKEAKRMAIGL